MAEQAETPATADKLTSFAHEENPKSDAPEFEALDITYDNNGVKGILNSPFVFGAALLASFGGFSFGYGITPIFLQFKMFNWMI